MTCAWEVAIVIALSRTHAARMALLVLMANWQTLIVQMGCVGLKVILAGRDICLRFVYVCAEVNGSQHRLCAGVWGDGCLY